MPLLAAMFTVPAGTTASLTANVTNQLADPETLLIIAVAAAIPLVFYVARRVIGLLPKGK